MTTLAAHVQAIIADELGVDLDEVTRDARLGEQLGADSADRIHLTMRLEEEFGLDIPEDDAEDLLRVGQVIDYITARTGPAIA